MTWKNSMESPKVVHDNDHQDYQFHISREWHQGLLLLVEVSPHFQAIVDPREFDLLDNYLILKSSRYYRCLEKGFGEPPKKGVPGVPRGNFLTFMCFKQHVTRSSDVHAALCDHYHRAGALWLQQKQEVSITYRYFVQVRYKPTRL